MATDRTNIPVTGVLDPVDTDMRTPAFVINNQQGNTVDSTSNAGLSVFLNPVQGNIGAATHEGDLGGAA